VDRWRCRAFGGALWPLAPEQLLWTKLFGGVFFSDAGSSIEADSSIARMIGHDPVVHGV